MGCSGSKQQKDVAAGNVVPRRLFRKQLRNSSKSEEATATAGADRGDSKEAAKAPDPEKTRIDDPARLTSSDEFYSSRRDMESLDAVMEGSEGAEYYSPGEVDYDATTAVVDVQHSGDKIASTGNGGDEAAVDSSLEAHATVRSEATEEMIENKGNKEEEEEEKFTMSSARHNYVESIGSNRSMDFKEAISAEEIEAEIVTVSEKECLGDQKNVKEHSTSH